MMRRKCSLIFLVVAAALAGCVGSPPAGPGALIAEGTVAAVGGEYGNLYTSIAPQRYEELGLEPGMRVRAAFGGTSVTMVVGENYHDVPSGEPVAVLHREGLTFAIRDGHFNEAYDIAAGAPFELWQADGR